MTSPRNPHQSSWAVRRKFMFAVSAFCMAAISYCLLRNLDTKVAEAAVTFAFLTLGGIVGSYVFGAAWEDISRGSRPPPLVVAAGPELEP
ncbi:MAG TPA: hypothetical protein VM326_02350 [Sphingomicrobium sp.]|nr:hypothetical protein [Sphingomicrobium sp.]